MKKNVTFKNGVWNLAGALFLPDDFDENKKEENIRVLDQIAEKARRNFV